MNSPLPAQSGKIELKLEEKDTRILGPFFLVLTFVFALALSPLFGATSSWWISLGCVAFCGITLYPLYRQVKPLIGASLVLDNTGIELLRNGERDFRSSWTAISNVRVVHTGFRPKALRLLDQDNRLLGEIPLGQSPVRYQELLGLIGKKLPERVRIEKLVKGEKGSLGGRILLASALTGAAIGSWFVAFQGLSAVVGSLLQRSVGWLMVFGVIALPFGLMQWLTVLKWSKRERADRLEPVQPLFKHAALTDLRQLVVGLPVSHKARYVYSPQVIEANQVNPSVQKVASVMSSLILAAMVGGSFWNMRPALPLAIVIPLMVLSMACTLPLPFLFIRKSNKRLAKTRDGFGDELIVEHRALWVVRGGRKIPARVLSEPTYTVWQDAPGGLNQMQIAIGVGDETWWYDPSSMFTEEGLAMLQQSQSRSPRKLTP